MFELTNLTKTYGDTVAVRDVDLTVTPNKTTVLLGPSGCGKSTLLRLMIGLVRADKGSVSFENVQLCDANLMSLRHKMGFVIQNGGLFPHLTARDNVTIMARYLSWPLDRINERLKELSELTAFPEDAFDRYPPQLSGGQQQRVSLMRSLMLDPDVLLMDEPLGALDPMIRSQLQGDLRSIFRSLSKTVILVTHDLGEAAYLGDVIVLMRGGKLVQIGSLDDLIHSPSEGFVTEFVNAQRNPYERMSGRSS